MAVRSMVKRRRSYAVVLAALAVAAALLVQVIGSSADSSRTISSRTISVNPYEGKYWGHSDDHNRYLHFHYIGTLESGRITDFYFNHGATFSGFEVHNGEFHHASFGRAVSGHWCNSHHLKGTFHTETADIPWHASYPNARDYPAKDPSEGPTERCP